MLKLQKLLLVITCLFLSIFVINFSNTYANSKSSEPPKRITNSFGMEFVYIEPGQFIMGTPETSKYHTGDEKPVKVTFKEGFYMQTTEVTQGQWVKVKGRNPSNYKDCGDNCPVENVSWNDVQRFIKFLNWKDKTGEYRLPYEAEWEYACRAGTTTPFSIGNCITSDQVNYCGKLPLPECPETDFLRKTTSVASYPPNQWGLYDMHGNVQEWCEDWYFENFKYTPLNYPVKSLYETMPNKAQHKVLRGGHYRTEALYTTSTCRYSKGPSIKFFSIGFRLVLVPIN